MAGQNSKDLDKDLEFLYDDCDNYENEISELYSYSEEIEFEKNMENFEILLKSKGQFPIVEILMAFGELYAINADPENRFTTWMELGDEDQKSLIMRIIQLIELADKSERFKAVTSLLYLVQGVYGECFDTKQQMAYCRKNCMLLYKMGIFSITKELFLMEIGLSENVAASTSKKPTLLSIADSKELRGLLIILYTMVETLRREDEKDTPDERQTRQEFLNDLGQSLNDNESLLVTLFNVVLKFCSDTSPCFPMKKVLLMIWKLLLTILGGFKSLHDAKIQKRIDEGLPTLNEDCLQIVREMKASVPPTSASDILEIAQGPRRRRGRPAMYELDGGSPDAEIDGGRDDKSDGMPLEEEKVTSIDDDLIGPAVNSVDKIINSNDEKGGLDSSDEKLAIVYDVDKNDDAVLTSIVNSTEQVEEGVLEPRNKDMAIVYDIAKDDDVTPSTGAMTPMPVRSAPTLTKDPASIASKLIKIRREQQKAEEEAAVPDVKLVSGLPWIPKAREKDVEAFLNLVRQKFIGFPLPGDLTTEAGLPVPTKDSISVLRRHQYTSVSELQIARENEITKFPLTVGKNEVVVDTSTERLYQIMLPNLPQYMIALLKILLAANPTSKTKNDSINILSDVLPEEMPSSTVSSLKVGIDVNRHREIIVKAISGIILLLLKHFKLSHIYQFEYASQHLVFANCIPLVLKFFNQNIVAYVTTKNTIPNLEFPACVIGEKSELSADNLEAIDSSSLPCWRNLFSSINLLRILNKLVKWKHSRTMMLVVFKSAPILKRALKVRQAMFQLYVLKLLKVQTKYLGRQWRKSNMKIMSAIYQKVRHRLNDDWAYGNDVDARPWDFQQEECALRACVERFNLRRYHLTGSRVGNSSSMSSPIDDDYTPVDNNIQNLLREEVDLPLDFRKSYDVWLEREVYYSNTDWDQLLSIPCVQ